MGNTFQLFLGHSQGDSVYANIYVTLPGDGSTLAAPFTLRPGESSGGVINAITGQAVDDDLIFCSLTYTAPSPLWWISPRTRPCKAEPWDSGATGCG